MWNVPAIFVVLAEEESGSLSTAKSHVGQFLADDIKKSWWRTCFLETQWPSFYQCACFDFDGEVDWEWADFTKAIDLKNRVNIRFDYIRLMQACLGVDESGPSSVPDALQLPLPVVPAMCRIFVFEVRGSALGSTLSLNNSRTDGV